MGARSLEVKVGALVLAALGLLAGFVFALGGFRLSETHTLAIDFPTTADLKPGAPVKVAGVPAGKVERVEFWGGRIDATTGRSVRVRVTVSVSAELVPALHQDARFYITTQGMLGEKYVEIDPGTLEAPPLPVGVPVVGVPPLRLEIMATRIAAVVEGVTKILEDNQDDIRRLLAHADEAFVTFTAVVAENRDRVSGLLDRLDRTVAETEALLGTLRAAVGDGSGLRATVTNAERATGILADGLGPLLARLHAALEDVQALAATGRAVGERAVGRLDGVVEGVAGLVKSARGLVDRIHDGHGSVGALLADQELYDDLRELLKDLKRHPWKLIRKE